MSARYAPGTTVVVDQRFPEGHIRTPYYCRGKSGVVERVCGAFRNPETLAFGGDGMPKRPLYRVRFRQTDLWPDYVGDRDDTVEIEIYEHWLRPAN
jgi:nitrile hydratase